MQLKIAHWYFCAHWLTSLATLVVFSLFLVLGFWQLERAQYKRVLYEAFLSQQAATAVNLNQHLLQKDEQQYLWHPVTATGYFSPNQNILLDNQVMNGKPGYFVYTPFQLNTKEPWVLVNRGWIPVGEDRSQAPVLPAIEGEVMISGILKSVPKTGLLLPKATIEKMTDTMLRVQNIELKQLADVLKQPLLPVIMRLEPQSDYGYLRDWLLPGSDETKHKGYAFQWFSFAAILILIYLSVNLKRPNKQADE